MTNALVEKVRTEASDRGEPRVAGEFVAILGKWCAFENNGGNPVAIIDAFTRSLGAGVPHLTTFVGIFNY